MQKTILVTGGAGFIGSNFVPYFAKKYKNYKVINLDKLTYAGNLKNLKECEGAENYIFVEGDICDEELMENIFKNYGVSDIIHFAAESHVDNSIKNPIIFAQTNVMGTLMLLEKARKYWSDNYENCRFHHISTDEVYGDLDNVGFFTETTPYNPSSPYSASKASSDMFVKAYRRTYGLNITISNCSNNYGPKQHAEKLIPTIIKKCLNNEKIPVYGSGTNIRDWLYVMDHCKAIDLIFHRGLSGETYNVGGRNEKQNIEVVKTICGILDKKIARKSGESYFALVEFVKDRAGHDKRYAIDAIKLESQLGWRAEENFESGITKTIEWYLQQLFTSFSE